MKKILKYFTILFFVILLMICLAVFALFYFNSQDVVTEEQVRETLSADQILSNPKSGFAQLTPEEQATYLRICNEIENLSEDFFLTGNTVTEEQFSKITNFILKDHPEYFYIGTLEYMKNQNDIVESVSITYQDDPETIQAQKQEVENWKNEVLAGITPDMDNYQTAKYLHDYLVSHVNYDESAPNNQNILSVVENSSSVCAGYAKAFQYLLNQAGIFSTYVSGTVDVGPHAWNLVQIDGQYGWVDVTWDDPSFKGNQAPEGYQSHLYFGMSSDELERTHDFDRQYETFIPFSQPTFNYYDREGVYFDLSEPGSYNQFTQKVREARANGMSSIEVKLANQDQVDQLLNMLSYDVLLTEGSINYISDPNYPVISFLLN